MQLMRMLNNLLYKDIKFYIPVFGLGCGVLGMHLAKTSINLGKYASTLLRALEYRGYDSTGAAFQKEDSETVTLLKDVGAPSTLVQTLGIESQEGKIFCGQVRWATFGIVNKVNAQPHNVTCKRHIYGAHNGNITNTRELKDFLLTEGHFVRSDNDGEMLVHAIEHYFDIELNKVSCDKENDIECRRHCMRAAIINASKKMTGSYAAVIVDPISQTSYAIKEGSSLYFGTGEIDDTKFHLASSDLTAVLRFTKMLIKLREGEFVEYTADYYQVFASKDAKIKRINKDDLLINAGDKIEVLPTRSKLRAEDTELDPEYSFFMEQEINIESESAGKLVKLFTGGSNTGKRMISLLKNENLYVELEELCQNILACENTDAQIDFYTKYEKSTNSEKFYKTVKTKYSTIYDELVKEDFEKKYFFSNEMNTFIDLIGEYDKKRLIISKALDSITEAHDVEDFNSKVTNFQSIIKNTLENSRNIYTLACGTSYHATMIAALFFNEIAGVEIIPILPGEFRGQYSNCVKDNDVIIGVSQSGETKDLIDVFNDIEKKGLKVKKIVLVNNMNSTLGQEKSDVSIPILCGPEIAVPATKSFINQIVLFFYLAIKTAEINIEQCKQNKQDTLITNIEKQLPRRWKQIQDIPMIIKETVETTSSDIDYVAEKIFMEPSMHILATKISGVAKEGALKIRETVLNHAEGCEASEFKHGPNTILGKNTVFGLRHIKGMIRYFEHVIDEMTNEAEALQLPSREVRNIILALSDYIFNHKTPFNLSEQATKLFKSTLRKYDFFSPLSRNYPLIYVTGPDDRDINLTISQINTHKIRGADTFIIAEENERLHENARTTPNAEKYYGWGYITLPKTDDSLMTAFSATVVLQLLALSMSRKKMEYLDKLGFAEHGVHPDVPKNVSKSITVD